MRDGLRRCAASGVGTAVLRLSAFEHTEQGRRDDTCAASDAQHSVRELTAANQVVALRPRESECPTCRKYLHHVQRSVFEGHLTDAQLRRFQAATEAVLDLSYDNVLVYGCPSGAAVRPVALPWGPHRPSEGYQHDLPRGGSPC
ncbi:CRISPR-associated endonuclease Cas2 [Streptomyces sp. NPDC048506]|uniref:CRISPR-associated endonuclease Cas2 n=1 Tax=Streptomyces sp. NPDC048506 TaxID=3155028 RepID=UPI003428FC9D